MCGANVLHVNERGVRDHGYDYACEPAHCAHCAHAHAHAHGCGFLYSHLPHDAQVNLCAAVSLFPPYRSNESCPPILELHKNRVLQIYARNVHILNQLMQAKKTTSSVGCHQQVHTKMGVDDFLHIRIWIAA